MSALNPNLTPALTPPLDVVSTPSHSCQMAARCGRPAGFQPSLSTPGSRGSEPALPGRRAAPAWPEVRRVPLTNQGSPTEGLPRWSPSSGLAAEWLSHRPFPVAAHVHVAVTQHAAPGELQIGPPRRSSCCHVGSPALAAQYPRAATCSGCALRRPATPAPWAGRPCDRMPGLRASLAIPPGEAGQLADEGCVSGLIEACAMRWGRLGIAGAVLLVLHGDLLARIDLSDPHVLLTAIPTTTRRPNRHPRLPAPCPDPR
jgi:hypothetical protein